MSDASGAPEIEIVLNGAVRRVAAGTSVAELLRAWTERPELVAVERNRLLVPRARHADVRLAAGDELEFVTLVGGG
jgi:thiamine biosynthesis protein ThiS